ncbi:Dabb family protein [Serratia marcescens]|uniref:Dabb family protein n=2 Tax=Serratia TaxID=613 RepID=A0A5C7BMI7_SERMA|nr:Dabb family protein [Serratia marcescens]TXE53330.1 Dabb family protein [Serratia marcescens]
MITGIRHLVLMRFRPGTAPATLAQIRAGFLALPGQVPGVMAVEWGENDSPEVWHGGLTHAVMMTFRDAQARAVYLPHPAHAALQGVMRPALAQVVVLDYPVWPDNVVTA